MNAETEALTARLAAIVGERHVLTAPEETAPYRVERRGLFASRPLAVVQPGSTEDVSRVVALCAREGVGMVPQAGNTGLVGGTSALAPERLVVVNIARLDRIREVDAANFTLTAEGGCTLASIQEAATAADRLFPLSYAAEHECRLGGNLATNAGGMNVLRYGNARDLALGLEVVLPDGRVWNGLTRLRKDNSGYDLRDLFIGAEGTLGIITAAVLKLFPRPRHTLTALVGLERAEDTVALLARLRSATGDSLTAFEFMSRTAVSIGIAHGRDCTEPFDTIAPWYVVFDVTSSRERDDLEALVNPVLAEAGQSGGVLAWETATDVATRHRLWRIRKTLPAAQGGEGGSIKHDVSVPVSRVPAFLRHADDAVCRRLPGIRPCAFGHVGDGNIHYNLTQPSEMDTRVFLALWNEFNRLVHDVVQDLDGSFAAEHGIGRLKPNEVARLKSSVEISLMQRVKQVFDPSNVMNPGVLTPPADRHDRS